MILDYAGGAHLEHGSFFRFIDRRLRGLFRLGCFAGRGVHLLQYRAYAVTNLLPGDASYGTTGDRSGSFHHGLGPG
jgi:hypothetical protein